LSFNYKLCDASETKLGPRLDALEQRLARIERETEGRLGPGALHETQRAAEERFETEIEAKIAALEERVRSVPGKLPVARTWTPQTVVYQAEFVSHDGALWQAIKDTATIPVAAAQTGCARRAPDATPSRRRFAALTTHTSTTTTSTSW
jgi:hypothetical protein